MTEVTILPWSVVVIGRWNRSILTPAAIGKKLLDLAETEPLQVEIPINIAASPRVRKSGVAISVEENQLFVEVDRGNYEALALGLRVAAKAIDWLCWTPFHAIGITVTFTIPQVTEESPSGTNKKWDESLSSGNYKITRHIAGRSIEWHENRIFVVADRGEDGSSMVVVNFERKSDKVDELKKLLETPIAEFKNQVESMLRHLKDGGVS